MIDSERSTGGKEQKDMRHVEKLAGAFFFCGYRRYGRLVEGIQLFEPQQNCPDCFDSFL